MEKTYSQTWTLYSPDKASEIASYLNETNSEGFMYALKKFSESAAAVEVFDGDGYSLGYL